MEWKEPGVPKDLCAPFVNVNSGSKMVAQVQIPEGVRGEVEEVVQALKRFFEKKGVKLSVSQPEADEDGTVYIYFDFDEYVKLSEKQFDKFLKMIRDLGFYNANGAENQIVNYIGYKEWLVYDEFRNLYKDIVINLEYYKVKNIIVNLEHYNVVASETRYYLKSLRILTNTIHDGKSEGENNE